VRLTFEPLDHHHVAGLIAALRDDRVDVYLPGPDVTTDDALHDRIDRLARGAPPGERWLNAAILCDGIVVGRLEATVYDAGWAEIAYLVGPAYWGRGYATRGVRWWIDQLGVDEIWAAVHIDNARSIGVLERCGFVRGEPLRPLGSYDPGDVVYVLIRKPGKAQVPGAH
jgi:RimJ/RimL family protein N-acetyltransferase